MTIFLLSLCALFGLAWAAFCAGAETGFLSVSRERVLHLAREGGRKAIKVQKALGDMGRTTTTILIGNNMASVLYSSATAAMSARLFGGNVTASAIWSFFAAFTVLYVSEFMPKLLFAARPLRRILALFSAHVPRNEVYGLVCSEERAEVQPHGGGPSSHTPRPQGRCVPV